VRSLDKFYKYLENHEAGEPHAEAKAAEASEPKSGVPLPASPAPSNGSRYVIRNGVTVAVPRDEEVTKAFLPEPKADPVGSDKEDPVAEASVIPSITDSLAEDGAIWRALPENVRRLAHLSADLLPDAAPQSSERRQLIERLLNPLLSLEDTARLLGVCTATVRRYANKGALAHQRTIGQQRRFLLSDVLALLESRKSSPEVPAPPSEGDR
jgi:excisionase family DNA binding protein